MLDYYIPLYTHVDRDAYIMLISPLHPITSKESIFL